MGLYDNLYCEYPLPEGDPNILVYQTKDTPCQALSTYIIHKDGTIFASDGMYKTGDTWSKPAREPEQWIVTGEVRFYDYSKDEVWTEYSTYFVDGVLREIHKLSP